MSLVCYFSRLFSFKPFLCIFYFTGIIRCHSPLTTCFIITCVIPTIRVGWTMLFSLQCRQETLSFFLEFPLFLNNSFNRYPHGLTLHLLILQDLLVIFVHFLCRQNRSLTHNSLHDLVILFINPLGFLFLYGIVKRL